MIDLPLVTIGIISFKDERYLKIAIPSLLDQSYKNIEILTCDNNATTEIGKWIEKEFSAVKVYYPGENLGFGRGHNFLIYKSRGDFYLAFNSDMFADKDFVAELMNVMHKNSRIAAVTGKLLRFTSFPNIPDRNQPQIIDTTGLIINRNHHVIDRGQGDYDRSQFGRDEEIWGASGAAPLYRIAALRDVAHGEDEYFDRDFFMYKEDVDLSFRLRWAGWQTWYAAKALAWHDRTAYNAGGIIRTIKKRRTQSKIVREQSFLNQLLLILKNWSPEYNWKVKMATAIFLGKYFLYVVIFEPRLLVQIGKYLGLRKVILNKSLNMPRRVSASEMEKWFV